MFRVLKGRPHPLNEQRDGPIFALGTGLHQHCRGLVNLSASGIVKSKGVTE